MGLGDASFGVGGAAGEWFGMALSGGEVVVVVVEGDMPGSCVGRDVGDGVECCHKGLCSVEVCGPGWGGAAGGVGGIKP